MKFKKLAAALSMVGTAVFFSGAALADPSITNNDGTSSPFGGFDWSSSSAAWTEGFTGSGAFKLNYVGWAVALFDTTGGNLFAPHLDNQANGVAGPFGPTAYEYTVVAKFDEKVIGCTSATQCTFQVTGGSFDIYYDTGTNAKTVSNGAWTGFNDGDLILSGTFAAGTTTDFNTATGGQANLNGVVTYTNSAFINPALVSTTVTSTLQLGAGAASFSPPSSVDGDAVGPGQIVFKADANQTFSAVPEPSTLALVGLALTGIGALARRRKSA